MVREWPMAAGDWLFNLEPRWVRNRPRLFGWMYTIGGLVLALLTAILLHYERGGWWWPSLALGAIADLLVGYRMLRG